MAIEESFLDPDSGFDFKLDDFHAGPCETFDPHYGVKGYDGNGDITSLENLEAFQEYVLDNTDGEGVHFVMADGVRIPHPLNNNRAGSFLKYNIMPNFLGFNPNCSDLLHNDVIMHHKPVV